MNPLRGLAYLWPGWYPEEPRALLPPLAEAFLEKIDATCWCMHLRERCRECAVRRAERMPAVALLLAEIYDRRRAWARNGSHQPPPPRAQGHSDAVPTSLRSRATPFPSTWELNGEHN